jgi:Ca-activated chloride channel family protein
VGLQVDNPLALLLLIPAIYVVYLFAREKRNRTAFFGKLRMTVRSVMFLLLILAIAGTSLLFPVQSVSTIFVVDRSDSVEDQEQAIFSQIKKASEEKSEEDQFAVISTGMNSVVERPLTKESLQSHEFAAEVNRNYSNLASGMQLGNSLLGPEDRGRVVLISDGNENLGDVKQQAHYLQQQGYRVDVFPIEPLYDKDVVLKDFELPGTAYLGENTPLEFEIESNVNSEGRLRVYDDENLILDEKLTVKKGNNAFSYQYELKETGFHSFKAEILFNEDKIIQNNEAFGYASVKGAPTVLIVEGEEAGSKNLESALEASSVEVETILPELLPTKLSSFVNYDSIIFANVSAHRVSGQQMQMINAAVTEFGIGFVMTGGNESFGLGGYFQTPVEKLLPVDMDLKGKKELPSLGLVLVLDRSGSMSGQKIQLAKEAASRSVELLRDKDTLGFIAFDDRPWEIIETKPIGDKEKVIDKIQSVGAQGGTEIYSSLELAYENLTPLELQRKHIILLTDGKSAASGDYDHLIEEGNDKGVTLSTVAIGNGADASLLDRLAQVGKGRFYNVTDTSTIPSILSRETVLMTKTYIVDEPFVPKYSSGTGWDHYFSSGVPQMNAYIATTKKGRAESVLVSEREDPILSRWQYGLGKTVAWTSDLEGEWSDQWPVWENWSPLWNDVVTWSFPQFEQEQYELTETRQGTKMNVNIQSPQSDFGTLEATVVNDQGEEVEASLRIKSPGEYETSFQTIDPGVYYLQLKEKAGEELKSAFKTGIVVPYSSEYHLLPMNTEHLKEIAEAGGGTILNDLKSTFTNNNLPKRYSTQNISIWLLWIAFFLFFFDVVIRRFEPSFAFLRDMKRKRSEKTVRTQEAQDKKTEQFSRLKEVSKKRTHNQGEENGSRLAEPSIKRPIHTDENKTRQSKKHFSAPSESQGEDRMERLLKAKKRKR